MSSPQSTIEKAEAARARGELWRAKEILQGSLGSSGFQAESHRALAGVLIEMKDTLEAGRHLYASGLPRVGDKEAAAVEVYLKRFGGSAAQLQASLPAPLRTLAFTEWPEALRQDFAQRGFDPPKSRKPGRKGRSGSRASFAIDLLLLGLILVVLGVGLVQIARWVTDWFA